MGVMKTQMINLLVSPYIAHKVHYYSVTHTFTYSSHLTRYYTHYSVHSQSSLLITQFTDRDLYSFQVQRAQFVREVAGAARRSTDV